MKLWLISQRVNVGYDTYDSAVVAAKDDDAARHTNPRGYWIDLGMTDGDYAWAKPSEVEVRLLGEAVEGTQPGVICASFNAG